MRKLNKLFVGATCGSPATKAAVCGSSKLKGRTTIRPYISLILVFLCGSLFAETILQQSFESASTDTYSYSANPSPDSKRIWWGPTSEMMGGAAAQEGTMYWAGWDLDNTESTLTFSTQNLPVGYTYQLSFWYYTKNLDTTNDYCRYSLMYDTGSNWDNWVTVSNNSLAWTQVTLDVPGGSNYLRFRLSSKFDGTTKYAHWDYITLDRRFTAPIVSNVSALQRIDGSKIVDIYYDLYDNEFDLCNIGFKVSSDNGASYSIIPSPANLSGDFGDDILGGTNRHIIWDAGAESHTLEGDSYLYRVYADDGSGSPLPENFVLVAGGTFNNGTSDVTVSSFYMDKYELTQAGYQAVMGTNPSYFSGHPNKPVEQVSWFNAIEYSNRRSLQEGITPCYSYSTYGTNPDSWPSGWNTDYNNHTNVSCNWTANGYRLPTEMEWQFAASGGNQTHNYTYSGSNTIGDVAWYDGNNSPYGTKPVGTKTANELGLYDMSGNVWEWNWDIYGSYPGGTQTNPHGATSGSDRVGRGGGWGYSAHDCTVTYRSVDVATHSYYDIGFRLCRVSS